jgi:hypothetical protein
MKDFFNTQGSLISGLITMPSISSNQYLAQTRNPIKKLVKSDQVKCLIMVNEWIQKQVGTVIKT